jgi:hypothetical protein
MREFSVVDTLKEIRFDIMIPFDMMDRADQNYAKALELAIKYLQDNNVDFTYPSQYDSQD